MKRCPTCQRTYTDEVKFCRVDGVTLVNASAGLSESEATRVLPESRATGEAPTEVFRDTGEGKLTTSALSPGPPSAAIGPARKSMSGRKLALIAALVVLLVVVPIVIVVAGYVSYRHARNTEVAIDSIAVLPFENQNRDASVEWLSDGVTESIINNLAQLPNLRVSPRSSVFRYKGKETDPLEAGKALGVRAVLTGRLQQRDDEVIISAELVDLRDNKQLWGEQYQRKMADLLTVQRDIAREITNNLRPRLSGSEQNRVTKQYTANSEAYQLYLKGRFYWNKRTINDFKRASTYFQQAIDKDPNYALAYSGLADSYGLLAVFGAGPPKDWMPQAKTAAMKALALDDSLAEAHASLGLITAYYDWDFVGAERELRRAIELNPNYATAHEWRAENISSLKRHDEALAEIRRALELDPLSLIINRVYADLLLNARRYDEAIEQYRKTIEIDPNFRTAHERLVRAYEAKGMYDQAIAEYLASPASSERLTGMKETYTKSGWNGVLQILLASLLEKSKKDYVRPFSVASLYARLGQKDEAFAWLEKAYQDRDYQMTELNVRTDMDLLRGDPRFADLLRRVGLPQ